MDHTINQIPVFPSPYLPGFEIGTFSYAVADFEAFKRIGFRVMLISTNKLPIEMKYISLDGAYYAEWGNDDTFLINFLAAQFNLVVDPIYFNNSIPTGVNGMGFTISYSDLVIKSGQVIYPNYLMKNSFGIIVNSDQVPVSFEVLDYDNYGNINTGTRVLIGPDGNPMLPVGYYVDSNGLAKTSDGKRIIIIYPVNTSFEPIPEPVFIEPVFQVIEPAVSEPVTEPESDSVGDPVVEPEFSDPVTEPEFSDPVTEPEFSDPVTEPEFSEPGVEPVTEPESDSAGEPVADPVVEPEFSDPVAEPEFSEPVAEPEFSEPVAEPEFSEPVVEPVAEPVVEPVSEPVVEPVAEPVVEPVVDSIDNIIPDSSA